MHGDFMVTNKSLTAALFILLAAASVVSAADIYKYEDSEGVIHFTDTPTDRRFKIFMRDIQKDRRLRTNFGFGRVSRNPAEFDRIINSCSTEFGVDKALVKAVIHAESGYNPNAVSSKGAAGLMQLMPGTAQDLKVADSFNPSENIRGGVRYLRFLLDTFKGDVSLALAAYNAGLGNVAKHGGIPPYQETRNYVSKVLDYQRNYAAN